MLTKYLLLDYIRNKKTIVFFYLVVLALSIPIKSIFIPRNYSKLFNELNSGLNERNIRSILSLVIFLWIIVVALGYTKNKIESTLIPDYLSYIRNLMFDNTISFYSENYKDIPAGEYITRCMDLSRNLRDIALYICNYCVPFLVISISISIYFTILLPKLGLIIIVGILVILVITYIYSYKSILCSAKREAYYLNMNEKLNDSLTNLMNIYINNQDKQEITKNQKIEKLHTKLYIEQNNTTDTLSLILSTITVCVLVSVLFTIYVELTRGNMSPVVFTSVILILGWYIAYVMEYSNTVPHILNKFGIIHNSSEFLKNLIGHHKVQAEEALMKNNGIEVENMDYKYAPSLKLMYQQFSIKIEPNEKVAIIGRSGSGKSTLAKLLSGIYKPTGGKILIGGIDTRTVSTSFIRKHVNYINQRTGLFNDTIIENMRYGNNASDADIVSMLQKYKLLEIYSKIEKGVYGKTGINGGNLSLGMQKVTMLVRGLLKDCEVMILDEPLAALDSKTREKVINLIQGVGKNRTIIIITHDKEIIPFMQRVINLDEAKMIKKTNIDGE